MNASTRTPNLDAALSAHTPSTDSVRKDITNIEDVDSTRPVFVRYQGREPSRIAPLPGAPRLGANQIATLVSVLSVPGSRRPEIYQMVPPPAVTVHQAALASGAAPDQDQIDRAARLAKATGQDVAIVSRNSAGQMAVASSRMASPAVVAVAPSTPVAAVSTDEDEDSDQDDADDRRAGLGDWDSPGMDDTARTRVLAQETAARDAGFALQDTIYDRGMLVNRIGVRTARAKRAVWARKDTVPAGMAKLRGIIAAEQRSDVECNVDTLRMNDNGGLVVMESTGDRRTMALACERLAMPQVFQRIATTLGVSSPGGSVSDWTAPRLVKARVEVFNAMAEQSGIDYKAAAENYRLMSAARRKALKVKAPKRPAIVLRTRLDAPASGSPVRGVFAAVSPKYAACDADVLAQACEQIAGGLDMRCDVTYDAPRGRVKIDLLAHGNETTGAACGEIFEVGIRLESSDTGKGGVDVYAVICRNRCLNYYVLDNAVVKIKSLRHMGDVSRLREDVEKALGLARTKIETIMNTWNTACDKVILGKSIKPVASKSGPTLSTVRADRGSEDLLSDLLANNARRMQADELRDEILRGVFRGLIHSGTLPIGLRSIDATDDNGNVDPDSDVLSMLVKAHDADVNQGQATDKGITLASLASAVTLYAHDMQDDPWMEADLERAGGEILSMLGAMPWHGSPEALDALATRQAAARN